MASLNARYLYLILKNRWRDLKKHSISVNQIRREIRRRVFCCKYAIHRAALEPKIVTFVKIEQEHYKRKFNIQFSLNHERVHKETTCFLPSVSPAFVNLVKTFDHYKKKL